MADLQLFHTPAQHSGASTWRTILTCSFALLAACGESPPTVEQHEPSTLNPKIVQGVGVAEEASPQIVRVMIVEKSSLRALCSGTVIGSNAVLTAAHCVSDALRLSVQSGGRSLMVSAVHIHPGFTYNFEVGAIFFDVALLITSEPLGLPALPLLVGHDLSVGDALSIYGFGSDGGDSFGRLRSGAMSADIISEAHIFARFSGKNSNTCSGDSGGPALVPIFNKASGELSNVGLVGVVSTGTKPDCSAGDTTLFTNVQNPLIVEFILNLVPDVLLN